MDNVENYVWTINELWLKYKGTMLSSSPNFFRVTNLQITHQSIAKTPTQPSKDAQKSYRASPLKEKCRTHVMLTNILHQTYTKSKKLLWPLHNPKLQLWWCDLQPNSSIHYGACPQHFSTLCCVPNTIHPPHFYWSRGFMSFLCPHCESMGNPT